MVDVHIELGPASSVSARAWVEYADETLAAVRQLEGIAIAPDAFDRFEALLESWRPITERDEPFHWEFDESPEQAAFLMEALFRVGLIVEAAATEGRARLRPPEADEFHVMLVHAVLATLEVDSAASSHFVDELRVQWGVASTD